jgi:hypothetical protein
MKFSFSSWPPSYGTFRTTITETLLTLPFGGQNTPETLIRARRILRSMPSPRWSDLIAAVVRTKS